MSNNAEATALQLAIENLVTSKTVSVEAAEHIQKIRQRADSLAAENAALLDNNRKLTSSNLEFANLNTSLNAQLEKVAKREADCSAREAKCRELEMAAAVADAKASTVRECFGLVFRNAHMREQAFTPSVFMPGQPVKDQYGNWQYPPGTSSPEQRTDITKTQE